MRKRLVLFIWADFFNIFIPLFFSLIILAIGFKISTIADVETVYLSTKQVAVISACLLSITLSIILPISFFFSLILYLTKISQSGELTSLFISRISVKRINIILFVPALLVSISGMVNSIYFKPRAYAKLQHILNIQPYDALRNIKAGTIKNIENSSFIYVKNIDNEKFSDVLYYSSSNEDLKITLISAKNMSLPPKGFFQVIFNDGTLVNISNSDITISEFGKLAISPFRPKYLTEISLSMLPTTALFHITQKNNVANKEMAVFCERIFLPLAPLIMLMAAFTFAVSNKKTGQIKRMIISLFIGIVFFAIFFMIYTLGKKEGMPTFTLFLSVFLAEVILSTYFFSKKFKRVF